MEEQVMLLPSGHVVMSKINRMEEDGWLWCWMPLRFHLISSDEWIEVVW